MKNISKETKEKLVRSLSWETADLCEFLIGDINEAVKAEKDYDGVIFGAAGADVLGGPAEALGKLKSTVKRAMRLSGRESIKTHHAAAFAFIVTQHFGNLLFIITRDAVR